MTPNNPAFDVWREDQRKAGHSFTGQEVWEAAWNARVPPGYEVVKKGEQEPVAWRLLCADGAWRLSETKPCNGYISEPLYLHPTTLPDLKAAAAKLGYVVVPKELAEDMWSSCGTVEERINEMLKVVEGEKK